MAQEQQKSIVRILGASLLYVIVAGIAATISVVTQGFEITSNNMFHVIFVLDWMKDPTFSNDAFVQSLNNFVSILWPLVRLIATEDNYQTLFFVLHIFTRWAVFLSIIFATRSLNIHGVRFHVLVVSILALSPLLLKGSPIGDGAVLTPQFTHTALAYPLLILSLSLMSRGWIGASLATTGLVFDLNAFVAVWLGGAQLFAIAGLGIFARIRWSTLWRRMALGLGCAAVIALPVEIWILKTLRQESEGRGFDYIQFLNYYYPRHFLIWAAAPQDLLKFAAMVLSGAVCFRILGRERIAWASAFAGLCCLFLLGALLPWITSASLLLNLHLLRVDGVIQWIAIFLVAAVAVQRQSAPDAFGRLASAIALILLALPVEAGIALAASCLLATVPRVSARALFPTMGFSLFLAVMTLDQSWPRMLVLGIAEIAATLAVLFLWIRPHDHRIPPAVWLRTATAAILVASPAVALHDRALDMLRRPEAAREAARWASRNTPKDSLFLIPPNEPGFNSTDFQILSHRKLWVDWKRGAAVMWEPSYYQQWFTRMEEVRALSSLHDWIDYACRKNIAYLVYRKTEKPLVNADVVFESARYAMIDVEKSCGASQTAVPVVGGDSGRKADRPRAEDRRDQAHEGQSR